MEKVNNADIRKSVNRKLIANIGIVFVGILLFLTFFSNTIYTINLPSVILDYPNEGSIKRSASGSGIVDFIATDFYYADYPGKIAFMVSEGDSVSEGDALFAIVADIEDLRLSLDEYKATAERICFQQEKAEADREYAQETLNQLKVESVDSTDVSPVDTSEYDYELESLQLSIDHLQQEVEDLELLLEQGAISKKDLEDKQNELNELNRQLQYVQDRRQKVIEDYNQAVRKSGESMQRSRVQANETYEERKRGLEKSIKDLDYQIAEFMTAVSVNNRDIEKLEEQIHENGRKTVQSDRAGIVTGMDSAIGTGAFIYRGDLSMRIGVVDEGFKAVFRLPETVDYLQVGDAVTFHIRSRSLYNVSGEVKNARIENGQLRVEVHFRADNVISGETAEITVHNTSILYKTLIPNSAVRTDAQGEYLLYVERVESLLGEEFYARRVGFGIAQQDQYNTAGQIYAIDTRIPLIIDSDKPVADGERVRIVGGGELVGIR